VVVSLTRSLSIAVLVLVFILTSGLAAPQNRTQKEIEAFNQKFREATLKMDNAATVALWAEDGTTLLPGMTPLTGKANIAKWLDEITARMPGYHVVSQENDFHDIQVSGDWASEWGTTVQVAQPPEGKEPLEIHGKILLILHREKNGEWKIKQEMWNASPRS
jgi:uncharacterized protein (TIGR02246 family)